MGFTTVLFDFCDFFCDFPMVDSFEIPISLAKQWLNFFQQYWVKLFIDNDH